MSYILNRFFNQIRNKNVLKAYDMPGTCFTEVKDSLAHTRHSIKFDLTAPLLIFVPSLTLPKLFSLIPLCLEPFRANAAAVERDVKMAAAAFAGTVRAASGQWRATRLIFAFAEGGTGVGRNGQLAWRLTEKGGRRMSLFQVTEFRIFSGVACIWPPRLSPRLLNPRTLADQCGSKFPLPYWLLAILPSLESNPEGQGRRGAGETEKASLTF